MSETTRDLAVTAAVPVFPSTDVVRALHQYRDLGFTARLHSSGGYGFLRLGAARIDIITAGDLGEDGPRSACSLVVGDPDGLAARMHAAGHGTVTAPEDKAWGRREGTYLDADRNLIRFGCPLPGTY